MIEKTLTNFGLSDKEIKVYMALLRLGSAPVRVISESSQINRTTTHDILRKLIDLGLASFVDKSKHRYFTSEPPENLLTAIATKKNCLERVGKEVKEILPELKTLYEKSESKPKAKYFEGEIGLRSILEDVIESCGKNGAKQYYVYSSSSIREVLHKVFPDYNQKRVSKKISVKTISIGPGGELHGLDERKWLSKEAGSPTYTIIYNRKVALISLDQIKEPIGVVIEDENTYKTQVMIFKSLWEKL
jgi:HTH-type transcriptional regulator, sugar sensing transcriptional regulator